MAVELSSGLVLTESDITELSAMLVGPVAEHIIGSDELSYRLSNRVLEMTEQNDVLSQRQGRLLVNILSTNPNIGADLIDALQDQFPQSVLSREKMLEAKREGWVVIDPLTDDRLQTSSYDVSLGEWFWVTQAHPGRHVFNPLNQAHVRRIWGRRPWKALTVLEHLSADGPFREHLTKADFKGLEMDDQVIILRPGETVLAHTSEYIGARYKATEMMKARSSYGRCFLAVCKDAGWGDIGYFNRWTMEIHNDLKDEWTFLAVGQPIAQMVFFRTNPVEGQQYSHAGSYQNSEELDILKRGWRPERMLPKVERKTRVI